jgi:uracil-DNA glycosylase family protein
MARGVTAKKAKVDARSSESFELDLGDRTLETVRDRARGCVRCPLYLHATQTVFGEGRETARIMFVGEQPGDREDLMGRPFVGPAGQLFDRALGDAGIRRVHVYVTNAVKHFKFEPRGKRRIHKKPNRGEVEACRFWLDQELALVDPAMVVALGATAAQSLLRRAVTISSLRGHQLHFGEWTGFVTVHPSYLLRIPDRDQAEREYGAFVRDLQKISRIADAGAQAKLG